MWRICLETIAKRDRIDLLKHLNRRSIRRNLFSLVFYEIMKGLLGEKFMRVYQDPRDKKRGEVRNIPRRIVF